MMVAKLIHCKLSSSASVKDMPLLVYSWMGVVLKLASGTRNQISDLQPVNTYSILFDIEVLFFIKLHNSGYTVSGLRCVVADVY